MSFRKLTMAAVAAVALSVTIGSAHAASVLAFGQRAPAGSSPPNIFTSTTGGVLGGNAGGTALSVVNGDIEVTLFAGATPTPFDAFLNLTATSVSTALQPVPGVPLFLQDFAGTFAITSGANGTGTNYLSGSFTQATMTLTGGVSGSLVGGTIGIGGTSFSGNVQFTSDLIPANLLQPERGVSFSMTNIDPVQSSLCPPGSSLTICAFTSNVSGNMSANVGTVVPGPAALALFGIGLLGLGAVARRKAA
jgi:hypothetical protein